jgi:hypothetical protein
VRVDKRNDGDRDIKKLFGEPRDPIERLFRGGIEHVQILQRVKAQRLLP